MKKKSDCRIVLEGLQVKSIHKARVLASALAAIEEECGIREVEIVLDNVFFCPWINKDELRDTEMERLIVGIVKEIEDR